MSIEDLTGTVVRKICMACSREFQGSTGTCPHDGNLLVALPQDQYVGRKIGDKYHVLSVIGTGGMGVVYLARHETMKCNVAIKMLRAQFASDQISVKRFTQEAIACRRLNHPNVITTYDHGFTPQGQPFIVMDCLQGVSLADEIKRLKHISVERVLHIFEQACDALDHAHKQGIIHRDLKPGNLMLTTYNEESDFVKVVDFGVAKILNSDEAQTLTQQGEVCGSPVYMSPEQCQGHPLDRRADIYSMGVVLYEALVGKVPFMGKSMVDTMAKHLNESPPPFKTVLPDVFIPERLEQTVMKALSKKPENRQQSMAALKHELMLSVPRPGQNPGLRQMSPLEPSSPEGKQTKWLLPLVSLIVLLVSLGAVGWFFLIKSRTPESATATKAPATPVTDTNTTNTTTTAAVPMPNTKTSATTSVTVPVTNTKISATSASSSPAIPVTNTNTNTNTFATTVRSTPERPVSTPKPPLSTPKPPLRTPKPVAAKASARPTATTKPRPVQTTAAPAKKSGNAFDRFEDLSRQRSYKVNR